MKVIDDGVIKYDRSNFSQCPPLLEEEYADLEYWRKKLFQLNLIGEYPEAKIGFGNISMVKDYSSFLKTGLPQFLITGTQTGKYPHLNGSQYTRILDYDIDQLKLKMMGVIEASSETLTHATIYKNNPAIKAVFHIHFNEIWKKMIANDSLHTVAHVPYGTVEMARATLECIKGLSAGAFCMHGHEDGVVIFGTSLEETWEITKALI